MKHGLPVPEGMSPEDWERERRCPVDLLDDATMEWLRMHSWLQRDGGGLWHPGSVGEQPARDLRALEIIGGEMARLQREHQEERQRHLSGGGGQP